MGSLGAECEVEWVKLEIWKSSVVSMGRGRDLTLDCTPSHPAHS